MDGESLQTRAAIDPLVRSDNIGDHVKLYLGEVEPPEILSPLNQDLSGLPPMLIQVGTDEVLLSDSLRLAKCVRLAGVEVKLQVWEHMWHVFQFFPVMVPEGRQAIEDIGEFVKERIE